MQKRIILVAALFLIILSCLGLILKNYKKRVNRLNFEVSKLEGINIQLNNKIEEGQTFLRSLLTSNLKKYNTYDEQGPIKLIRLGRSYDGGYVVPEIALERSDAVLGYGVSDDISFEEDFSNKYNKNSYGFDCSIDKIDIENSLVRFIPECIASGDTSKSKNNFSTFKQQIQKLGLENKKLFIKMDIEGAEYDAFPDIIDYSENITGIAMEIHTNEGLEKALSLISTINQNFYLVNLHENNCHGKTFTAPNATGEISELIQLSFINRNLIKKASLSDDQSHPSSLDQPNCAYKDEHRFSIN